MSSNRQESFEWQIPRKKRTLNESGKDGGNLRLGVLISGNGSNLQALIDAIENRQLLNVEIALVVSNNANAYGLQRALKHTMPVIYLPWSKRVVGATQPGDDQAQYIAPTPMEPALTAPKFITPLKEELTESEARLTALLHLFQVDLIVLAGWMRILGAPFLEQFPRRIINLHPALLPDDGTGSTYTTRDGTSIPVFRGLHVVKKALDAGVQVTGSTVHYVTPEVDAGPVICREEVAIESGDTVESLSERLKLVEHRLIVEAVRMLGQA